MHAKSSAEGVRLRMAEIKCKVCTQLEEAAVSAEKPDPASHLLGLTEAGLRNRALQKAEQVLKTRAALEKHRNTCPAWTARPAFGEVPLEEGGR